MVNTSKADPKPTRRSVLRLVAVCVAAAGVVLSIVVWMGARPVNDQKTITLQRGHLESPPKDLLDAIKRAKAAKGMHSLAAPTEQPSGRAGQPLSPEEAVKAFGDAVKAAQGAKGNQQPSTSAASPFGSAKN